MGILVFSWSVVFGQEEVSFTASTDAKTVLVNSNIEVTFTLINGQGRSFTPPKFHNFDLLAGPSTMTSYENFNGQATRKISYTYVIRPKKKGNLTLNPATIVVKNKTLRSNPLTIEVVGSAKQLNTKVLTKDEAFFFRAEPSTQEAVIGQEITLDFKLYVEESLTRVRQRMTYEPAYTGCFSQAVNWYKAFQEVVDGRQYRSWIIRRVVLYPQQTGTITIDPAQMSLDYSTGKPSFGFFGAETERVILRTEPVDIQVAPVPDPNPDDFIGLVGEYEISASIDKRQMTTDDAMTFRLNITGTGDMKRLQLPDLNLPLDTFEVYPPKITREFVSDKGGSLHHVREIEYLVLPKTTGNYPLQTSFSYFSQDSSKFLTVSTNPVALNIRPGTNTRKKPDLSQTDPVQEADRDIRFIHTSTRLKKAGSYLPGKPLFWAIAGLPFLLFIGGLVRQRQQLAQANIDPGILRQRRARKLAQKHLAAAKTHLDANAPRQFYDEISKGALGYLSDKLHLERSKLSKDNVREKLNELAVTPDKVETFMHILKTCEMALFAGQTDAGSMQSIYEQTEEVIMGIETALEG